jgi:hypothetical protein
MKKLSIFCMFALVFGLLAGPAIAQKYEVDVDGDQVMDTELTTAPGSSFCIDIWLTGGSLTQEPTAGGVWIDYVSSVGLIDYVSATDAVPPWGSGPTVDEPAGAGTFFTKVSNLGSPPAQVSDGAGNVLITTVCFDCVAGGDATLDLCAGQCGNPGAAYWGPAPAYVDATINTNTAYPTLTIHQVCECVSDEECDNGLWCDGEEYCEDCTCLDGDAPCDDADPCTLDNCDDDLDECTAKTCDAAYAVNNKGECCGAEPCSLDTVCQAGATLIKEDGWYQPPQPGAVATIKNRICLDNPSVLVGGIQFDICDEPDCLTCIDCELTERTVMFDCVVLELPDGCCRVIMFCKNPGCAINPGLCDIVTVVMQTKDPLPAECAEGCIIETFGNIVVSDYDGFEIIGSGVAGELCPVVCGDVCPPGTGLANDCGDGVVDIYDIMCEVDFALTATTPNACQLPRADVPTGTPPNCTPPDGDIDIMDIMVLIDMALNRQDCCSFYYQGIIY